jgi:hypothetical protein
LSKPPDEDFPYIHPGTSTHSAILLAKQHGVGNGYFFVILSKLDEIYESKQLQQYDSII